MKQKLTGLINFISSPIGAASLLISVIIVLYSGMVLVQSYSSKIQKTNTSARYSLQLMFELIGHDVDNMVQDMRSLGDIARLEISHGRSLTNFKWETPLSRKTLIIAPDGTVIADSRQEMPALETFVGRDAFFSFHKNSLNSHVYFGESVQLDDMDGWQLPISVAIRDPANQNLVAVVYSTVDTQEWFAIVERRLGEIKLDAFVSRPEGDVLASVPYSNDVVGSVLTNEIVLAQHRARHSDSPALSLLAPYFFPAEDFILDATSKRLPMKITVLFEFWPMFERFILEAVRSIGVTIILVLLVNYFGVMQYRSSRESQRLRTQLLDTINTSSEGYALFDSDDRLVLCNEVYRDHYKSHAHALKIGNTLEEILREGLKVGCFPDAIGREEEWLAERLMQHQATETIEQRLSDGRWLLISERRTRDGGIVGVRTDITGLKLRESQLRESEKRFMDFTETASDWVWETDAQHAFINLDGGAGSVEQRRRLSFVMGKRRHECTSEDTSTEKWHAHLDDLNAPRPFRDFRYWMTPPWGKDRLISVSGLPVISEDGVFTGFRGSARDITDEYRNIEQIMILEERFRTGFESITTGIILTDQNGEMTSLNPAACEIFSYNEDELIGRNISTLIEDFTSVPVSSRSQQSDGQQDSVNLGKPREVNGRRNDGDVFPLRLGVAEMVAGGTKQFIASIVDLTKERKLETRLRQSQKMEAVGQLVGGVSHDFNNLLGIIVGNLDLISRNMKPDTRTSRQLARAREAAQRGAKLTRKLLNFSRQEVERAEPINVHEALEHLHEFLQRSITTAYHINLNLESDIPQIAVNPSDLEDAIINICLNARDAMGSGGNIEIATEDFITTSGSSGTEIGLLPGQYVKIAITDTGEGMSPEVASKIFEPFFTTKVRGKGSGLGLSMVYGFVKRSGGMITVRSTPGKGATFNLYFPTVKEAIKLPTIEEDDADRILDVQGSETILIVDDEIDLLEIASTVLNDAGYATLTASNAYDALEVIKAHPEIDLLFTDVIMPGNIDGGTLAMRAKKLRPNISVCLTSGFTGTLENGSQELNGVNVLKKPYTNQGLTSCIRELLDARQNMPGTGVDEAKKAG